MDTRDRDVIYLGFLKIYGEGMNVLLKSECKGDMRPNIEYELVPNDVYLMVSNKSLRYHITVLTLSFIIQR